MSNFRLFTSLFVAVLLLSGLSYITSDSYLAGSQSAAVITSGDQTTLTLLTQKLRDLQAQLAQLLGQQAATPASTPSPVAEVSCPAGISKNLSMGKSDPEVRNLQVILNFSADTQVAETGPGSPGQETTYFGNATKAAVIEFQEKNRESILTPNDLPSGTGYVGLATRNVLNECSSQVVSGSTAVSPVVPIVDQPLNTDEADEALVGYSPEPEIPETPYIIPYVIPVTEPVVQIDVCANIVGTQTALPTGYGTDTAGNCIETTVQPSTSTTVPIVTVVDVCPNITGEQTATPAGYIKDSSGNCVLPAPVTPAPQPPADVCPNLSGAQAAVPSGYVKNTAGSCVTAPATQPTVTASITQDKTTTYSDDPVKVSWSSTNATSCKVSKSLNGAAFTTLTSWAQNDGRTAGFENISPTQIGTHLYKVICTASSGDTAEATMSHTVLEVIPPLPTISLAQDKSSTTANQGFTLSWSSTNATACTIMRNLGGAINSLSALANNGKPSGSGTDTLTQAGTYVYSASCTGGGGKVEKTISHTVTAATAPTPPTPQVDLCINLSGAQASIPVGYTKNSAGDCVLVPVNPSPTDVCPNIAGVQSSVPAGYIKNTLGSCVLPPSTKPAPTATIAQDINTTYSNGPFKISWSSTNASVCKVSKSLNGAAFTDLTSWTQNGKPVGFENITPTQIGTHVYKVTCTGEGGAAEAKVTHSVVIAPTVHPPTDVCPNILGNQATVPAGYIKNAAGQCLVSTPDVCLNIAGNQTTIPSGYQSNAVGQCVRIPALPVDKCPNIAGNQTTVPTEYKLNSAGQCDEKNQKISTVAQVWAGIKVALQLLVEHNTFFVAYYDKDKYMTVASKPIEGGSWVSKRLPTQVPFDYHNDIEMEIDNAGYIHVSGNMHAVPLQYYRSTKPYDVTTLTKFSMTGQNEERVTYPFFFKSPTGELMFSYRNGASGDGDTYVNIYNTSTQTWKPYLTTPLFDGSGSFKSTSFVATKDGNRVVSGDWNGDGKDEIGFYDNAKAEFYLYSENTASATITTVLYGAPGNKNIAITGDWNGDGIDSIGLYDPSNKTAYLRNLNTPGKSGIAVVYPQAPIGAQVITGDWDGDKIDTLAFAEPGLGRMHVSNSNQVGSLKVLTLAPHAHSAADIVIAGDWEGRGREGPGWIQSDHVAYLRSLMSEGVVNFTQPTSDGIQFAGKWNGVATQLGSYNSNTRTVILRRGAALDVTMSAYPSGPIQDKTGMYHMMWMWRSDYPGQNSRALAYARSRDLIHWENAAGKPVATPFKPSETTTIVDPVPVEEGIINSLFYLGVDGDNRPVISYLKYDENHIYQIYVARFENGKWVIRQMTHWTTDWHFVAAESLKLTTGPITIEDDGYLGLPYKNALIPELGILKLDPTTLAPVGSYPPLPNPIVLSLRNVQNPFVCKEGAEISPLVPGFVYERGKTPQETTYFLRWEVLRKTADNDRTCEKPIPAVPLELYKINR